MSEKTEQKISVDELKNALQTVREWQRQSKTDEEILAAGMGFLLFYDVKLMPAHEFEQGKLGEELRKMDKHAHGICAITAASPILTNKAHDFLHMELNRIMGGMAIEEIFNRLSNGN